MFESLEAFTLDTPVKRCTGKETKHKQCDTNQATIREKMARTKQTVKDRTQLKRK